MQCKDCGHEKGMVMNMKKCFKILWTFALVLVLAGSFGEAAIPYLAVSMSATLTFRE